MGEKHFKKLISIFSTEQSFRRLSVVINIELYEKLHGELEKKLKGQYLTIKIERLNVNEIYLSLDKNLKANL